VIDTLVAEESTPSFLTIAFPRLLAAAELTARIRYALPTVGALPA